MKIVTLQNHDDLSEFEQFLNSISDELAATICKKMQAYSEFDDIYPSNQLKILKPKIWGYKGTIYKLRVDCGKESARVMFTKSPNNELVLLHGFLKKSRKTPSKDAKIAIGNLERVKEGVALSQLAMKNYGL